VTSSVRRSAVNGVGSVGAAVPHADDPVAPTKSRGGRTRHWLAVTTVSGLPVATEAVFAITERLKLTPPPIDGTRVSETFSPVCRCARSCDHRDWFGKVGGLPVRPGLHRLAVEARDDAGNTSTAEGGIEVGVNPPSAKRRAHRRKPNR
jgi:hypothetical protein